MAETTNVQTGFWRRQQAAILALVAYIGLTAVMTWPLISQLGSHIPGLVGDSYVHLWTFEFVKNALLSGQTPYFTDQLFYPEGTTLVFHNIAWVNIMAWLGLQAIVGGVAAYTLAFMGVFVLNGFTTFLLAKELFHSAKVAFLSGLICAFWPFILSHHDTPNLILVAWVPLVLLNVRRLFAHGRVSHALFASLFIIFTGISRWQVLIMAAPLIGFYVLYKLWAVKSARTGQMAKLLGLIVVVSGLGLLPLMSPLIVNQVTRTDSTDLFVDEEVHSTDLLGFVVPNHYHPLWGESLFDTAWQLEGNVLYVPFLGFTTLILAIIGAIGNFKNARFWLFIAFFYALFSLGSRLHINGTPTLPLPYALVEDFFLVQTIRFPERLNVMLSIPMAILAGFGVLVLLRRPTLAARQTLLIGGLSLLILAEYAVIFPTLPIATPAWYKTLTEESGDFAILDIPMNMRKIYDKQYMIYQLEHQRPLIEGHISRPPEEAFAFINSIPLLALSRDEKVPPVEVANRSAQLQQLNEAGIRYLVLHKQFLKEEEEAAWRDWLVIEPIHEDADVVVYQTARSQIGDEGPMLAELTPGEIGLLEAEVWPRQAGPGSWVNVDVIWGSETAVAENRNVCFTLTGSETIPLPCQPVSEAWPTTNWQANEIVQALYQFQIEPDWKADEYQLELTLQDEAGATVGDTAVLQTITIEAISRLFAPPETQFQTAVQWQEYIALTGYNLEHDAEQIRLNLVWQALAEMETAYKFFVHVREPETGKVVAQIDFVSQNWQYPTTLWLAGEYVPDPITIPIADLANGRYDLWLGIYHPDTGERLLINQAGGATVVDTAVLLNSIEK